jgi:hypothetical protein
MPSDEEIIRTMREYDERLTQADPKDLGEVLSHIEKSLRVMMKGWLGNKELPSDSLLGPDFCEAFVFLVINNPAMSLEARRAVQKFVENYEEAGRLQDPGAKRIAQRTLREVVANATRWFGHSLKDGVKSAAHRLHGCHAARN